MGVLPGVTIKATHTATGNTFEAVTDQRGAYRIPVRVGVYKITQALSAVDIACWDMWENGPLLQKWHDGTLGWLTSTRPWVSRRARERAWAEDGWRRMLAFFAEHVPRLDRLAQLDLGDRGGVEAGAELGQ